jgi:hypothetical protein
MYVAVTCFESLGAGIPSRDVSIGIEHEYGIVANSLD